MYFNPNSFNRSTDPTPRFYLAPIELLHVEDAAFSDKAEENGYVRYANNYWRYKDNTSLSESEVLSIYEKIKTSYPYGYITNDPASINKYIADVKENEGFQSFYKKYWELIWITIVLIIYYNWG